MKVFQYKAVRSDGQRSKGSIEATSKDDAKRLLREQQLIILDLKEAVSSKSQSMKMSFEQQVIFTSQLAQLLEANVPLYESLEALEEQAEGESYQGIIFSLREHIRKGSSFSAALSHYPETFSSFFRAIVVAGESVGRLDQALIRLSQQLSSERQSKQRLISALIYPAILSILLVVSLGIMIFFVIPSIESLFEDQEIPAFTSFVLSVTHFIHAHTWFLGLSFVGAVVVGFYLLSKPDMRSKLVVKMLTWPILGQYLLKSSLGKFSRTLSNLLLGGTTLSTALEHAKEALGNRVLEEEIAHASDQIVEGKSFSSSLQKSKHLPPLFARMVSIGEETGRLAPILANLAKLYEEDSDRTLERAVGLIQPILLITMGVAIGSMLFAVLLPLASFGATLQL
jgi:type II secretory pathway component PulF